jgi:hypothetical protein
MSSMRNLAFPFSAILMLACGGGSTPPVGTDAGHTGTDSGPVVIRCGGGDDPDMDTISSGDEGEDDPDMDGLPNLRDPDSDGDGLNDVDEAGDRDCNTRPVDSDGDTIPNYLDRDANGDGVDDSTQRTTDTDGDGTPDAIDGDVDGDGIDNGIEAGPDASNPIDTDTDGTPDVFDLDSDGDTIYDSLEGAFDSDHDGAPNYLDLDSDADDIQDADEAGDGDLETPPFQCASEINAVTGMVMLDGLQDYRDADSDNDGLGDSEERAIGTNPCAIDTDMDGLDDLAEGAYELYNCPDHTTGTDCGCATNAHGPCTIPAEHFYVVLPFQGAPVERELTFSTTIRVADIFFMSDTTGSMGGVITNVSSTIARPGTGLIARISDPDTGIPDAWFGAADFKDMPFGGYGGGGDWGFNLTIPMTHPSRAADVAARISTGWVASGGSDGPESHTEALWQAMTGEGGTFMGGGSPIYTIPRYVGDCLDTGWGAPCFREAALPIIVFFTDICGHNGPPGEDASCDDYTGITPAPHTWAEAIAQMNIHGAKFVGIGTNGDCSRAVGPDGFSPCYYLRRTADETGSVDLDGIPLVYNLPASGSTELFVDTIVRAIDTIAHRVPLDVDTGLRDDPSDEVNATRFIKRRQPSCRLAPPPAICEVLEGESCWVEPEGLTHDQAVACVDASTFFGVIPGTRVTFRITFQNDFQMGGPTAQLFIAFIDVRAGGSAILDTREAFIVVPADSGTID